MRLTLPSGLVIKARQWNLGDQSELLDTKITASGLLPLRMAEEATECCVDPGPYPFAEGGTVNWNKVSLADITAANVLIRKFTDPDFSFEITCKGCNKPRYPEVNMHDVDIYEASEEGIDHLRTEVPIVVKVPEENPVAIVELTLLRGGDLPNVVQWQEKDAKAMLEIQACLTISKIIPQDAGAKEIQGFPRVRGFWRKQGWGFGKVIRKAIDEAEGGPDMLYTYKCDRVGCGVEQLGVLPLDTEFYGVDPLKELRERQNRYSERKSRKKLMQEQPSSS